MKMIKQKRNDTLYQQISVFFEREIREGRLKSGYKLPHIAGTAETIRSEFGYHSAEHEKSDETGVDFTCSKRGTFVRESFYGNTPGIVFGKCHAGVSGTGVCKIQENLEFRRISDAILLTNNCLFQGVWHASMEIGIKVPDELAIITHLNKEREPMTHISVSAPIMNVNDFVRLSFNDVIDQIQAIQVFLRGGKTC